MNSIDRVSQGVQIAANLGVVLSIVFLAYQIGEQRELMKAQTRTAISSEVIGLLVSQATDEGLAGAVRRDYAGEELSLDDKFRMDRLSRAYFRYWENVYYQYRNGLYDEEEYRGSRVALKDRLSRPGVMATWCETEKLYSPEFITEVKRLLPSGSSCATSGDPH